MDFANSEREREEWELSAHPEGERQEMIDLYVQKGVSVQDATLVMDTLMKVRPPHLQLSRVGEVVLSSFLPFITLVTPSRRLPGGGYYCDLAGQPVATKNVLERPLPLGGLS